MCEVPVFNLHVNIDSYCHIKVVLTFSMERFSFWFLATYWPTFPNYRTCHTGVIQPSLRCECLFFGDLLCAQILHWKWISMWHTWLSCEGFLTPLLWNLKVLLDVKQWLQSCLSGELPLVTDTATGLLCLCVTGGSGQARILADNSLSSTPGTGMYFFAELLSTHSFAWNIWNAIKLLSASQIRTRNLEPST